MGRQMRMSAVVSLCLAVMAAVGGAAAADLGGGEATAVDAKPSVDLGSDDVVAAAPQPGMLAKDRAASMVTLDPEDAGAGADLGEALQGLAGVHVESLGGLGKLATMSIRGSSGNQVAVFMDGIRLSGGTGSVDLSNYPLRHFSRVEVVNGDRVAMVRPFRRGLFSRVGLSVGEPLQASGASPAVLRERVASLLEHG